MPPDSQHRDDTESAVGSERQSSAEAARDEPIAQGRPRSLTLTAAFGALLISLSGLNVSWRSYESSSRSAATGLRLSQMVQSAAIVRAQPRTAQRAATQLVNPSRSCHTNDALKRPRRIRQQFFG